MPADDRQLSRKGERYMNEIIEATLRCLARDGYAATSIQRVADEAGLAKRMVIYYVGSREGLIEQVIAHVGDRILSQAESAAAASHDPEGTIAVWFDHLWNSLVSDPALLIAWYGLVTESVTSPHLRRTTATIIDRTRDVLAGVVDEALARGYVLKGHRESLETFMIATIQGMVLDLLQHGDTPRLRRAVQDLPLAIEHLYARP